MAVRDIVIECDHCYGLRHIPVGLVEGQLSLVDHQLYFRRHQQRGRGFLRHDTHDDFLAGGRRLGQHNLIGILFWEAHQIRRGFTIHREGELQREFVITKVINT